MPPSKRARMEDGVENGDDAASASASANGAPMETDWTLTSWRSKPILQQPEYPDPAAVVRACDQIRKLPPVVQAAEVQTLKRYLGEVAAGKRFILQGGDCAERFQDCSPSSIESKIKIILQMSLVLVWGAGIPLVRIGRIAGQYMKPRSKPKELVDGEEVYSYKGDSINSFGKEDRVPNPERLLQSYFYSHTTMNFVRGLATSGFADLSDISKWDLSFVAEKEKLEGYHKVTDDILHALDFMQACGMDSDPNMSSIELFSSHEGLVLDFEEAVTRQVGDAHYNLGAHFLWIGDRTRQLDGAHVEYFRGISNPIGIKVGPTTVCAELIDIIKRVSPDNEPGRITLITRFGAPKVKEFLPSLIQAVTDAGLCVVWECDPMHGNTETTKDGIKTRNFQNILSELLSTFEVHSEMGTWLGGVHFELTGEDVTECTGGSANLSDADLHQNYQSFCDPRLNYNQSLEMAFKMAEQLRLRKTAHKRKHSAL